VRFMAAAVAHQRDQAELKVDEELAALVFNRLNGKLTVTLVAMLG
jgi:hypothetical protein